MKLNLSTHCLRWARDRARWSISDLATRMKVSEKKIERWEIDGDITLAQAEKLAHVTHTPFGYLFLPEPPVEQLPVTDFRTVKTEGISRVSTELMDTLNDALLRQDWYREYAETNGAKPLTFVGSLSVSDDIARSALTIQKYINWDSTERSKAGAWEKALVLQIEAMERSGILVMRNGVVGNNTHRPLDVSEFRGFALADSYAPLIFINNKDAKAAQMFTLAHELVHLFLNLSGVSNLNLTYAPDIRTEKFCNEVAAELLVPLSDLKSQWAMVQLSSDYVLRLVKHFKVSSLVILRRLRDAKLLNTTEFNQRYTDALAQFNVVREGSGGGEFYRTLLTRLGARFTSAVVESALEGHTLYHDAYRLLGVSDVKTIRQLAEQVKAVA